MKYLISLIPYILGIIIARAILTGVQLLLPQGEIKLTYNQAVLFIVTSIIIMAMGLKVLFDKN